MDPTIDYARYRVAFSKFKSRSDVVVGLHELDIGAIDGSNLSRSAIQNHRT